MAITGTSISDRLNGVIESLDKKTKTKVKAEYGEDIASKVEHISKQIENLPEGGEGGGSGSGDERLTITIQYAMFGMDYVFSIMPGYDAIWQYWNDCYQNGKPRLIDFLLNTYAYEYVGEPMFSCVMRTVYVEGFETDPFDFIFVPYLTVTADNYGNPDLYQQHIVTLRLTPDNRVTRIQDATYTLYQKD